MKKFNTSVVTDKDLNFSLNARILNTSNISIGPFASAIIVQSSESFDETRERKIPVMAYARAGDTTKSPLVIISHGHTIRNDEYSAIAQALAEQGYYVVSIQHDLSGDPVSNKNLPIYERRLPSWQCGVQNILFVVNDENSAKSNRISTRNLGE